MTKLITILVLMGALLGFGMMIAGSAKDTAKAVESRHVQIEAIFNE